MKKLLLVVAIAMTLCGCQNGESANTPNTETQQPQPASTKPNTSSQQAKDYQTRVSDLVNQKKYDEALKVLDEYLNNIDGANTDTYYADTIAKVASLKEEEQERKEAEEKAEREKAEAARKKANKEKEKRKKELMKKVKVVTDEVTQSKTYYHKTQGSSWSNRLFYFTIFESGAYYYPNVDIGFAKDDWVFFDTVIFSIDGENFTKYFNSFDTLREVNGGKIIEQINFQPNNMELEWLKKICTSKKTIIRYQGDNYYYDVKVNDKEKKALKDMIELYELMNNLR